MITRLILLPLVVLIAACSSQPKAVRLSSEATVAKKGEPPKIRVLTFNVENLFDLEDDPAKNDESFLPASKKTTQIMQNKCRTQNMKYKDQSTTDDVVADSYQGFRVDECLGKNYDEKILTRKLRRMTDVVAQINDGHGPDVLILQEIENESIVKKWRDEYLTKMGYQTLFFVEGPDERGIDVAILSKLPKASEAKYHLIDFTKVPEIPANDIRPTRGILEGTVKLPNGENLSIFAVHFPSQGASTNHRKAGLLTLMDVTSKVAAGTYVIAGGDFNITAAEEWKQKYYRELLSSKFTVSHLAGCKDCPGSTYYNRDQTWSFFDVLLFSPTLSDGKSAWRLNPNSIRLANGSKWQVDYDGKPAKFRNGLGSVGVSDHWPMYAEIQLVPDQTVGAVK